MALKAQTYDAPTATWTDVVSVVQEVVSTGGTIGVAVRTFIPLFVADGVVENALISPFPGACTYVRIIPTIRTFIPLSKFTP